MKKIISFSLLLVLLLLAFFSCKVFEPENEALETSTNVTAPKSHELFNVSYSIDFVALPLPAQIGGYFDFSRPMNTSSVESNLVIYPVTADNTLGAPLDPITFNWVNNNTRLEFQTVNLYLSTQSYLIKISKNARDNIGNGIYGNYTGVTCDEFTTTDWYEPWDPGGTGIWYDYGRPFCEVNESAGGNWAFDNGDLGNIPTSDDFTLYFLDSITWNLDEVLPADVNATNITFSPSVDFTITTTDNISYTLIPTAPLTADTDYTISINMGNIIDTNNNSGSDGTNIWGSIGLDGNDNVVRVKFNTHTTQTDALHYGGYGWVDLYEEVKFWFNTPNTDNDYLDHSTINYDTISIEGRNFYIELEDSILDKRTYIKLKSVDNESLRWHWVNFSYKIADIDGYTLDGNWNNRLEGDDRDDYSVYLN